MGRDCRSVELRALCNEVPRTPPGPEGSNGTGNASGAADRPKFLAPGRVIIRQSSVISKERNSKKGFWLKTENLGLTTTVTYGLPSHRTKLSPANISGSCRPRERH